MLKRLIGRLSLIIGGLLGGLLLVELGLRLVGFSYPTVHMAEALRGHSLLPGAEGWWRSEGEAYFRVNTQGLRDREHAIDKASDVFRIAVLGDSFAQALQIPLEETFWHVLEQKLTERACFETWFVEVINFGVSGYGTAQQLLTLRNHVWQYDPDLVLLAFFTSNDIQNNAYALERNPEYPYFVYQANELVLDEAYPAKKHLRLRQWLGYGSRYLRLLEVLQLVKHRRKIEQYRGGDVSVFKAKVGLDNGLYQEPTSEDWQAAWRVTEGLLVAIRDEAIAKDASFLLVTISSAFGVHPDPNARETFKAQLKIDDFFYADRRLEALAERENMAVLSLYQPFQSYAEHNQTYLHGFENTRLGEGHWNAIGHRLAGELITDKICTDFRNHR